MQQRSGPVEMQNLLHDHFDRFWPINHDNLREEKISTEIYQNRRQQTMYFSGIGIRLYVLKVAQVKSVARVGTWEVISFLNEGYIRSLALSDVQLKSFYGQFSDINLNLGTI